VRPSGAPQQKWGAALWRTGVKACRYKDSQHEQDNCYQQRALPEPSNSCTSMMGGEASGFLRRKWWEVKVSLDRQGERTELISWNPSNFKGFQFESSLDCPERIQKPVRTLAQTYIQSFFAAEMSRIIVTTHMFVNFCWKSPCMLCCDNVDSLQGSWCHEDESSSNEKIHAYKLEMEKGSWILSWVANNQLHYWTKRISKSTM